MSGRDLIAEEEEAEEMRRKEEEEKKKKQYESPYKDLYRDNSG